MAVARFGRGVVECLEGRRLLTVSPTVASLTLVNANTGMSVNGYDTFANGSVLDLDALGANNFSVRANPAANTITLLRANALSSHPIYLAQRHRLYVGMRRAGMPED